MSVVFFTLWQRAAKERNELAARCRALNAAYDALAVTADLMQVRLDEVAAERDDLAHHLELMACDNTDLERVNEALRSGLSFFDPTAKGEA